MKYLALLMAVVLMFTLVACTTDTTDESSAADVSNTVSTEESKAESKAESSEAEAESSEAEAESSEAEPEDSSEAEPEDSSETGSEDSSEPEEYIERVYDYLEIKKASTAPVVDGKVEKGEYASSFEFDFSKTHWNVASDEEADAYDVVLYLSWDETYLYSCVEIRVGKPRTYDNTDFLSNRPYIFDRRHVMTAVVTSNPDEAKYMPPSGTEWDWSAAYNSGLGTEWTITSQPDGSNIKADHFGSLTSNSDYQYIVKVSGVDFEYYEQRIPWAALQGSAGFKAEAGTVIGYAFSAALEEVDIDEESEEETYYACFGDGIVNYKNFADYVNMTLAD